MLKKINGYWFELSKEKKKKSWQDIIDLIIVIMGLPAYFAIIYILFLR